MVGQVPPVAQLHETDVADPLAVDEDPPRFHPLLQAQAVTGDHQRPTVLQNHRMLRSHAHLPGQLGVFDQVAILAVHRDEEAGSGQGENRFELFAAGMTGDVNLAGRFVEDLGPPPVKMVDELTDRLLVPGDELGGEDDGVPFSQRDLFVVVHGDAGEGAQWLPLAAGGQDEHLLARQLPHLAQFDQGVVGNGQIAELAGDGGVGHHAATVDEDFAVAGERCVDHLLDAVNIRREGGDDDAAGAMRQDFGEGFPHRSLREGMSLPLDVGGVGHQQQDALLAVGRQSAEVGRLAVNGGRIEFEVASVDDESGGGADRQPGAVDDGVGGAVEFHLEGAEIDVLAWIDPVEAGPLRQSVLFQFPLQQTDGQAGAVDRRIPELLEEKGDGSDVIFVAVGQHQGADVLLPAIQRRDVGEDQIDPEHVGLRKHQSAVDQQDFSAALQGHHVEADFAQPPQGEKADGVGM